MPRGHLPGDNCRGAIDVGFKHDLYVLAIGRMDATILMFDLIVYWQGTKKAPLDGAVVAAEACGHLKDHGIDSIDADQYCDVQVKKDFAAVEEWPVVVNIENQSEAADFEKSKNLTAVIRRGLCLFPDDPVVRKDLLSICRLGGGRLPKFAAPQKAGFHDDVFKACALVAIKLLPLSAGVDVTEANRKAMPQRGTRDWRTPEDEPEFGGGIMDAVY